jgi:hypothetical protein
VEATLAEYLSHASVFGAQRSSRAASSASSTPLQKKPTVPTLIHDSACASRSEIPERPVNFCVF